MNRDEIAFRVACETRKRLGRVRHAIRPPAWRRKALSGIVRDASPLMSEAKRWCGRGDYGAAHATLARHFATRRSVWPLSAAGRAPLIGGIPRRFPQSVDDTRREADRIVSGTYDLLGYRGLPYGTPPDWHLDAVHQRRPPLDYWASIPYLDPRSGDHKIIWELNRHQHWGVLGRAWWLTGDERYRDRFVAELDSWVTANPPLAGVNWASMLELAFRSLSWTWSVEFFAEGAETSATPWMVDLLIALDRQLSHVARNLSRYFSPNTHLTGEALALFACGLAFPELRHSSHYAELGRGVLVQEAHRQIRADGGHAELSAHYHRYSTDFYLLATQVARAAGDPAAQPIERAARIQAKYLRTIADDRGRLPLIGDDDGGQLFRFAGGTPADASATLAVAAALLDDRSLAAGPTPEAACWILGDLPAIEAVPSTPAPWGSRVLRESGYVVSRSVRGDHLVFDAGPHGFLNGGHAHSDALSIVLTVAGRPLLIDPGTATYTMDAAARDRFRSTRMHNTVVLDGRNHVDPRGPFHWTARPDARIIFAEAGTVADVAQGTHDAYDGTRHVRTVIALHATGWVIVDHVLGTGRHEAEAWWHVHPGWTVSSDGPRLNFRHADGAQVSMATTAAEVEIVNDGPYAAFAPEYGRVERAPAIRLRHGGATPFAFATFIPAHHAGVVAIDVLAIDAPPPADWGAAAFAIDLGPQRLNVLAAATRDGGIARLGPGGFWGTAAFQTDGPLALAWNEHGIVRTHAPIGAAWLGGNLASAVHNERAAGF